jgi:hypothetical protein
VKQAGPANNIKGRWMPGQKEVKEFSLQKSTIELAERSLLDCPIVPITLPFIIPTYFQQKPSGKKLYRAKKHKKTTEQLCDKKTLCINRKDLK